uniref:Cellulose binding protein n=1 Tax=Meloidogyne incognita TaxID=6306 RepID=A0A914KW16_MELIC
MASFFYFLFISVSLLILANADDAGRYPSGDDLVEGTTAARLHSSSDLPDDDEEECECEDDDETTVATHISTRSNGYPSNNGAPTSTKRPSNNGSSNNGGSSSVTGSVILRDKWVNGANCILAFKNNGNARACGVKFELTLGDNQRIQSIWNVEKVGDKVYRIPDYIQLGPGVENRDIGVVYNDVPEPLPTIKVLGQEEGCKHY